MNAYQKSLLRIAILGTRGIPAAYGGFETFAEELSARLVARGHHVTVYGRRFFFEREQQLNHQYRGVEIKLAPTFRHKYFETPVHSLTTCLLIGCKYDAVILCNAANSPFAWILRLKGLPVLINVDGIERRRSKWNALGRAWYRLGEVCSVLFANKVVADADTIAHYYLQSYGCEAAVIRYGASPNMLPPGPTMQKLGLWPKKFVLYVSRLEPENNALGVIQAYCRLETKIPLVIVGDAPYSSKYKNLLRQAADERVIFAGFQFGEAYRELRSNCYFYVQATEVGGTHPALVEAMAYGNCVIANATPEHMEVLGGAGLYYWRNDFECLRQRMAELIANPKKVEEFGEVAKARAAQLFNWERIVDQYEELARNPKVIPERQLARV